MHLSPIDQKTYYKNKTRDWVKWIDGELDANRFYGTTSL